MRGGSDNGPRGSEFSPGSPDLKKMLICTQKNKYIPSRLSCQSTMLKILHWMKMGKGSSNNWLQSLTIGDFHNYRFRKYHALFFPFPFVSHIVFLIKGKIITKMDESRVIKYLPRCCKERVYFRHYHLEGEIGTFATDWECRHWQCVASKIVILQKNKMKYKMKIIITFSK